MYEVKIISLRPGKLCIKDTQVSCQVQVAREGTGLQGPKNEFFGGSVITERLYIDVKQDFKIKKNKKAADNTVTLASFIFPSSN